ncbi:hypothetical protein [Candidatus Protochlamydia phocaeensis]|uniref:hypothetical protein n=1 Tax=Candidatus Protochlamydia phocaeensis TaxID=1414722 RepID=UPI0008395825|nr:hypothetical protein [Candidatus Protochlamydia phocaeensis]
MTDKRIFFNPSHSISYSKFLHTYRHAHPLKQEKTETIVDIDFFRRSISLHYHYVYTFKRRQHKAYRIIFFGFALLFFILSIFIYFKTANYACTLYFSQGDLMKNCIDALCLLLAFAAFGMGYTTNPDKEALRFIVKKVEKELRNPAKHVHIELNDLFKHLICEQMNQQPFLVNSAAK